MQCGTLQTGRGCLPGCTATSQCAVGLVCQGGECIDPNAGNSDSGCPLCPPPGDDAGGPIHFKDAGHGSGSGSGGCGCSHAGEAAGLFALAALAFRRRRVKGGRP